MIANLPREDAAPRGISVAGPGSGGAGAGGCGGMPGSL